MDITRDVMVMTRKGKSVDEMRKVIVNRYSGLGPSTDEQG